MDPFCYLCFMLVFVVVSVPGSLVITCCERLTSWHICVVFSSVCVTFPYGVLSQVWYWIVSIPDLRFPLY